MLQFIVWWVCIRLRWLHSLCNENKDLLENPYFSESICTDLQETFHLEHCFIIFICLWYIYWYCSISQYCKFMYIKLCFPAATSVIIEQIVYINESVFVPENLHFVNCANIMWQKSVTTTILFSKALALRKYVICLGYSNNYLTKTMHIFTCTWGVKIGMGSKWLKPQTHFLNEDTL